MQINIQNLFNEVAQKLTGYILNIPLEDGTTVDVTLNETNFTVDFLNIPNVSENDTAFHKMADALPDYPVHDELTYDDVRDMESI